MLNTVDCYLDAKAPRSIEPSLQNTVQFRYKVSHVN
jgi:hypothetical protein